MEVVVLFWVYLILVIVLGDIVVLVRLFVSNRSDVFWVGLVVLVFVQGFCSFSLLSHLAQLFLQLSNFFICLIQLSSIVVYSIVLCISVVLALLAFHIFRHLFCLHGFFFFRPHSFDNFVVIRLLSFFYVAHSFSPSLFLLQHLQTRHFFDPFSFSLLIGPSHQFLLSLDSILDCLANKRIGGSSFDICNIQAPKVLLILNCR